MNQYKVETITFDALIAYYCYIKGEECISIYVCHKLGQGCCMFKVIGKNKIPFWPKITKYNFGYADKKVVSDYAQKYTEKLLKKGYKEFKKIKIFV